MSKAVKKSSGFVRVKKGSEAAEVCISAGELAAMKERHREKIQKAFENANKKS